MDIALIDAGGANLGSVKYALERLGVAPRVVREAGELAQAERIVLPGVGAAAPAMTALRERGLDAALRASTVPLLGICLGMQLLYEASEEGAVECLGLIPGRVRRLRHAPDARIPHMGWNTLSRCPDSVQPDSTLLEGMHDGDRAYFVHSFAAPVTASTLASTRHGVEFSAVVRHGRYVGMQFHPERSSVLGEKLLRNFIGWQP